MQTQLQSIADQMQHYNRNKSIMGEGLPSPPGHGSTSTHPPAQTHNLDRDTPYPTPQFSSLPRIEFPTFDGDNPRAWKQETTIDAILHRASLLHKSPSLHRPLFKPLPSSFNSNTRFLPLPIKTPFAPHRKLLTASEMRARREKNLCYNCDEVFVPGHRCKQRQVYMIMSQEEEEAYIVDVEDPNAPTEELLAEDMTISINAIYGNSDLNTLRIKGWVKHSSIQILIDSGSTDCFLDETVATNLGCHIEFTNPMLISVADGNKMVSRTICPDFTWEIQSTKFTYPMRIIKLGGCDVVLGGDWFRNHSPVELQLLSVQDKLLNPSPHPDYSFASDILRIQGILSTYQRAKALFIWPHMEKDIISWIASCETCQRAKGPKTKENRQIEGLINELGKINYPNDDVQRKEEKYQELTRIDEDDAILTEELKISDGQDKTQMDGANEFKLQQTLLIEESKENNQKLSTFKGTNREATRGGKRAEYFAAKFYLFLVPLE
ncbi:hypothetical protein BUALT_Bualt16G0050300 [Buddleja alternifolia]|uniref:Integrase zinc-binding domain-containing protein n=1 Tax=Buddleja alternifolia TaxID=168488 RepID=A0AAV6WK17_9LAMI|nr:hypothetical protein BUALT_Bualt16G0050300 [Buddleja alternifolia]